MINLMKDKWERGKQFDPPAPSQNKWPQITGVNEVRNTQRAIKYSGGGWEGERVDCKGGTAERVTGTGHT